MSFLSNVSLFLNFQTSNDLRLSPKTRLRRLRENTADVNITLMHHYPSLKKGTALIDSYDLFYDSFFYYLHINNVSNRSNATQDRPLE